MQLKFYAKDSRLIHCHLLWRLRLSETSNSILLLSSVCKQRGEKNVTLLDVVVAIGFRTIRISSRVVDRKREGERSAATSFDLFRKQTKETFPEENFSSRKFSRENCRIERVKCREDSPVATSVVSKKNSMMSRIEVILLEWICHYLQWWISSMKNVFSIESSSIFLLLVR